MIWAGYIDHVENEIYKNFRFKNLSRRGHLVDLNLDWEGPEKPGGTEIKWDTSAVGLC
jgi:hypothetical protein